MALSECSDEARACAALPLARRAMCLSPHDPQPAQRLLATMAQARQWAKLARIGPWFCHLWPAQAEFFRLTGVALHACRSLRAQDYLRQAWLTAPDSSRCFKTYLEYLLKDEVDSPPEVLIEQGRKFLAEPAFQHWWQLVFTKAGRLAQHHGQWRQALQYFKEAARANPQAPELRQRIRDLDHKLAYLCGELELPIPKLVGSSAGWNLAPHTAGAPFAPSAHTSPLRVLHLLQSSLPYKQTGYAFRSQALLECQQHAGIKVLAVTPPWFGTPSAPALHPSLDWWDEPVEGVPYRHLKWTMPDKPLVDHDLVEWYAELVLRVVEEFQPMILHAHTGHFNALAALAVRSRCGLPVVYEVRNLWEDSLTANGVIRSDGEMYRYYRKIETDCMQHVDCVLTLCAAMETELRERGVSSIEITPHCIDSSLIQKAAPSTRWVNSPIVGFFGALNRYEGLDTLLNALALPICQTRQVHALIVGAGPCHAQLQDLAQSLGIAHRVRMLGAQPGLTVLGLYQRVDCVAIPRIASRVAQLVTPIKVLEALASGKPVIASRVAALTEVVVDRQTGLVFQPDCPEELAQAIATLVDHPTLGQQLGAQARAYVTKRHNWPTMEQTYLRLYHACWVARCPTPAAF